MATDYWTYRPSKRPSVKQVSEWDTIFTDEIEEDWRGMYGGSVIVQNGRPFPDFYKVKYKMGKDTKWQQKLFYGETAWSDTERFVTDLGFHDFYGVI
jgi:hypothetical protein